MGKNLAGNEKPWYFTAVVAFLRHDIPVGVSYSDIECERDLQTLSRRLACEGESFLTKTLPAFGKAFDLALQGNAPLSATFFKKKDKQSALPAFLHGLLRRVFLDTGWVKDEPCITSIRVIRQLCYWCKKIEKGFTDESRQKAIDDFINVDQSLPLRDDLPRSGVLGVAKAVIEHVIGKSNTYAQWRPKHGPGSVAGGGGVVGKRFSRVCYTQLEKRFPPYHFFFSLRDIAEDYKCITQRPKERFGFSRTALVEKDSSGPRIIGLEPSEYMWCQQAIKGWLYKHIESHPITRGRVNFTDQTINRNLTVDWSTVDTLDMSKASDRNSLALVEALFEGTWLWPYLQACRTPGTVLPSGKLLWFKKFAPMGSAVCFPIEALVFYALAVGTLRLQGFSLFQALRSVYVYGDDLITPHGFYDALSEVFESFGLKFNTSKCCIHGKFRESCGADTYAGEDVTPIRMRKIYPTHDATSVIPVVKHANSLIKAGYWGAGSALREAFYAHYPEFRKLRIPLSDRTDYPFLYWQVPIGQKCSKIRLYTKNSITYARGLGYEPIKTRMLPCSEGPLLLESLSLGGPVGKISRNMKWFRQFDTPYKGKLKMKRFVISGLEGVAPSNWLP